MRDARSGGSGERMGFLEASSLGSKLHSALDDDLNVDGGKCLFFGSRLEDFANQPKSPRSCVQVHSTIDPPPTDPNQPLWIRLWHHDVDDPSSNQPPVDDEWFYTDNRALGGWQMAGQGGGIYSEVPVSVTAQAASVFGVSPQAGDNFRVNAQIVGTGMYGITVPQGVTDGRIVRSDGQTLRSQGVLLLLMVWRVANKCVGSSRPPHTRSHRGSSRPTRRLSKLAKRRFPVGQTAAPDRQRRLRGDRSS